MSRQSAIRALRQFSFICLSGGISFCGICVYKYNEKFYDDVIIPLTHFLSPETAHNLTIFLTKHRLIPKCTFYDPTNLKTKILNIDVNNPIGLAAGFDKDGEAIEGLHNLGFGFVEIGSVTPQPQPGNPKPRVFRLSEDKAVINRYGFNSEGHDAVLHRLKNLRENKQFTGTVGVNLGRNKIQFDPVVDYVKGIKKFSRFADYLVINISSPNTPGLRSMQSKEQLQNLLKELNKTKNQLPPKYRRPLFLKLAPDLDEKERKDIAYVLKQKECQIDGLIISNTTVSRKTLKDAKYAFEDGGLSGQPLSDVSTQMISDMYKLTKGKIPIIGVGGIFSGKDAFEKICAGASAVQIYTSFIYHGPPVITKIKKELGVLLKEKGFNNISEAVGSANIKK